jgi:hypothetical protein
VYLYAAIFPSPLSHDSMKKKKPEGAEIKDAQCTIKMQKEKLKAFTMVRVRCGTLMGCEIQDDRVMDG